LNLAGDPLRRAGALLFVGAAQFLIFLVISESLYPGYSVSKNTMSDLGATCNAGVCTIPRYSIIFNSSVFIFGALVFIGAFFIYISRSRLIGGLSALAGWGVMGVAIFPETAGAIHLVVAFIAFLFASIAAILSYKMLRPPMSYFAIVLGSVALISFIIYAGGAFTNYYLGLGQGGLERLIVYPDVIWALGFGAQLMGRPVERIPMPVAL
jgi:hypothetical membrane protein